MSKTLLAARTKCLANTHSFSLMPRWAAAKYTKAIQVVFYVIMVNLRSKTILAPLCGASANFFNLDRLSFG